MYPSLTWFLVWTLETQILPLICKQKSCLEFWLLKWSNNPSNVLQDAKDMNCCTDKTYIHVWMCKCSILKVNSHYEVLVWHVDVPLSYMHVPIQALCGAVLHWHWHSVGIFFYSVSPFEFLGMEEKVWVRGRSFTGFVGKRSRVHTVTQTQSV